MSKTHRPVYETPGRNVINRSVMVDLQTFKGCYLIKDTIDMTQILQSLGYVECYITLPKFAIFGLFILILGTSAIMDQTTCCFAVTSS